MWKKKFFAFFHLKLVFVWACGMQIWQPYRKFFTWIPTLSSFQSTKKKVWNDQLFQMCFAKTFVFLFFFLQKDNFAEKWISIFSNYLFQFFHQKNHWTAFYSRLYRERPINFVLCVQMLTGWNFWESYYQKQVPFLNSWLFKPTNSTFSFKYSTNLKVNNPCESERDCSH